MAAGTAEYRGHQPFRIGTSAANAWSGLAGYTYPPYQENPSRKSYLTWLFWPTRWQLVVERGDKIWNSVRFRFR